MIESVVLTRAPWIRPLGLLLVSAALLACGAVPREAESPSQPNIVLISIDSLRPDHLGCYGYSRDTSPTLDRLAAEGALFEVVSSSSSWTLPAHAALFTALPDFGHQVDRGSRLLPAERRTMVESLKSAGYRTLGVWSGPLLDPRFGFGQGFDEYWSHRGAGLDDDPSAAWGEHMARSHEDVTGLEVLEKVKEFAPSPAGQPYFLFLHLWDVHYDYIPPAPFDTRFDPDYQGTLDGTDVARLLRLEEEDLSPRDREHLVALYDGEIAWTDSIIAQILYYLEDRGGGAEDTVVVVTADHGEEFWEHGAFGHKRTVYEESVRIPLIVHGPGRVRAGVRVGEPVSIVDIAPTLLDLAGAEPLPDVFGRSLVSALDDPASVGRSLTVSELTMESRGEALLAVRGRDWKVISSQPSGEVLELYSLKDDPGEQRNLSHWDNDFSRTVIGAHERTVAELESLRDRHLRGPRDMGEIPPDIAAQLRSLGYIGGPVATDRSKGVIWAEPNPLQVCDSPWLGETVVHWRASPTTDTVEIQVEAPDGSVQRSVFATGGAMGEAKTPKWVGDGLQFHLVDKATGETLASTRIDVLRTGC